MARTVSSVRLSSVHVTVPADFYRQEFMRHRECLARQREYFSELAISKADQALARVLNDLEQLCSCDNADQLLASLLRQFNAVTGLSAWSDPKQLH
jgi:hypothetical protein